MGFGIVHAADFWVKAQWTIGHIQDIWELGKYDENP
jgi:hypothetical protein